MPEGSTVTSEFVQSFNAMQAQLGLTGQAGSISPLGLPTPAPASLPRVVHPGEMSQQLAMSTQANAMQTMHIAQRTVPMGGMMPMGMGGGFSIAPGMPAGSHGGMAQAFQGNMAAIQANQIASPFMAQMMAQGMGQTGFQAGMMPSASAMTAPGMGLFRPLPQAPMPMVNPTYPVPVINTPFTAQPQMGVSHTPMDFAHQMGLTQTNRVMAMGAAGLGMGANASALMGAGLLGAGAGSYLTRALHPRARAAGAILGAGFGAFGAQSMGFGEMAERATSMVTRPFLEMRAQGLQMQRMSENFVVGGQGLNVTGRGLNFRSSERLARELEDVAFDPQFRNETNNMFVARDMMRITNMAGQQGMLDFAQRPDQIKQNVIQISKALKSFMQLANEPDIQRAMMEMGRMRQMGISVGEMRNVVTQGRMFSRMAGMSMRELTQEGGLPGAMMYQQAGLSAGLGLQMGQGAFGMARQAIAGGAFNEQQLAMLGGMQGIAQRQMQMGAGMLRLPTLAAAGAQFGPGGFSMNRDNVRQMMTGQMGIQDMVQTAAGNLQSAVARGGVGALAMFQSQQRELQDRIGREMGPMGMQMMQMRQAMDMAKFMGLKGPGALISGARALGMDPEQAQQMNLMASSPDFFRNMRQQVDRQMTDVRLMHQGARERNRMGSFDRAFASWGAVTRRMGVGARRWIGGLTSDFSEFMENREMEDQGLRRIGGGAVGRRVSQRLRLDDAGSRERLLGMLTAQDRREAAFTGFGDQGSSKGLLGADTLSNVVMNPFDAMGADTMAQQYVDQDRMGAMEMALLGATVGSVLPGVGTLVGAGVGATLGFVGGAVNRRLLGAGAKEAQEIVKRNQTLMTGLNRRHRFRFKENRQRALSALGGPGTTNDQMERAVRRMSRNLAEAAAGTQVLGINIGGGAKALRGFDFDANFRQEARKEGLSEEHINRVLSTPGLKARLSGLTMRGAEDAARSSFDEGQAQVILDSLKTFEDDFSKMSIEDLQEKSKALLEQSDERQDRFLASLVSTETAEDAEGILRLAGKFTPEQLTKMAVELGNIDDEAVFSSENDPARKDTLKQIAKLTAREKESLRNVASKAAIDAKNKNVGRKLTERFSGAVMEVGLGAADLAKAGMMELLATTNDPTLRKALQEGGSAEDIVTRLGEVDPEALSKELREISRVAAKGDTSKAAEQLLNKVLNKGGAQATGTKVLAELEGVVFDDPALDKLEEQKHDINTMEGALKSFTQSTAGGGSPEDKLAKGADKLLTAAETLQKALAPPTPDGKTPEDAPLTSRLQNDPYADAVY